MVIVAVVAGSAILVALMAVLLVRTTEPVGSSEGPDERYVRGTYTGPAVSFRYPDDWHEFFLEAGSEPIAAYGPVSGGDADYAAIFHAPSLAAGEDPRGFLETQLSDARAGAVEVVDVNGMSGYSIPIALTGSDGSALLGRAIFVVGERANYLIACQSSPETEQQVMDGCQQLVDTLAETAPPDEDPSRCTDVELELLVSAPLPDGSTTIRPPTGIELDEDRACDMMAEPASPDPDPLFDHFRSRLTEQGWMVEGPQLDRTAVDLDVWQMVAVRDWDQFLVEVYVGGDGVVQHFFVTVADG